MICNSLEIRQDAGLALLQVAELEERAAAQAAELAALSTQVAELTVEVGELSNPLCTCQGVGWHSRGRYLLHFCCARSGTAWPRRMAC